MGAVWLTERGRLFQIWGPAVRKPREETTDFERGTSSKLQFVGSFSVIQALRQTPSSFCWSLPEWSNSNSIKRNSCRILWKFCSQRISRSTFPLTSRWLWTPFKEHWRSERDWEEIRRGWLIPKIGTNLSHIPPFYHLKILSSYCEFMTCCSVN